MATIPSWQRRTRWLAIAGLVAFGGCTPVSAAEAESVVPDITLPRRFEQTPSPMPDRVGGQAPWWAIYRDSQLDALIKELHTGSTGIAQARARLALARAAVAAGRASQGPALGLDGSATHAEGPLVNAAGESGNLFTTRVAAGWQLDLFGRLRADRDAERLDSEAAGALFADTTLLMEGETAHAWFAGRSLAREAVTASGIVALRTELLTIALKRRSAGLIPAEALDQAQRELDAARQREASLVLDRDRAARALGFLLGRSERFVPAPASEAAEPPLPEIPAELPADLLLTRPDIAAARNRLLASDARLRSARTGWVPVLDLTVAGGMASPSLMHLLTGAAGSFGLGSLLSIPLFDSGRHKARIAGRKAERDLAEAQYREAVLLALREVNDHLQDYATCRSALTNADAAARDGWALRVAAQSRSENGTLGRAEATTITIAAIERAMVGSALRRECFGASVDLLQALGAVTN